MLRAQWQSSLDKASTLELFWSGRLRYRRFEFEDRHVRFYGETAVLSGKARVEAQSDGKPVEQLANVTRVWVRQQSHWRLAAVQTTRVGTNP